MLLFDIVCLTHKIPDSLVETRRVHLVRDNLNLLEFQTLRPQRQRGGEMSDKSRVDSLVNDLEHWMSGKKHDDKP